MTDQGEKTMYYTGVGSRDAPARALETMKRLSTTLAEAGWILRSGHALGADKAFEDGAVSFPAQIFLPWSSFGGFTSRFGRHTYFPNPAAWTRSIARDYHPMWSNLSSSSRLLHQRNVHQVLGPDLNSLRSSFVACWTPQGLGRGGTGQALRIAKGYGVPTFDLGEGEHVLEELLAYANILC